MGGGKWGVRKGEKEGGKEAEGKGAHRPVPLGLLTPLTPGTRFSCNALESTRRALLTGLCGPAVPMPAPLCLQRQGRHVSKGARLGSHKTLFTRTSGAWLAKPELA